LIAFGLSERQTLAVLYGVALISGLLAAAIESINYWLSLALAPLLLIGLALAAAYLGGIKVVSAPAPDRRRRVVSQVMLDLTYRYRLLEIILDFALIAVCFYLAFLGRYGLIMNEDLLELYLQTLPLALACSLLAFYVSGVYRGIWRYVDFDELARYAQASIGAVILMGALMFISSAADFLPWRSDFPRIVLILFGIFLLLGLAATRLSFRAMDRIFGHRGAPHEQNVLIYGAGDPGEIALRWLAANPQLHFHPVGFVDDDPLLAGRRIHGVEVCGGLERLPELVSRKRVTGIILVDGDIEPAEVARLRASCREQGCWLRCLTLQLELLADGTDTVENNA
jgi:UDP-GlcNAc:undecaprenyl-phosphate GlcNAc-1-phosphate transferase